MYIDYTPPIHPNFKFYYLINDELSPTAFWMRLKSETFSNDSIHSKRIYIYIDIGTSHPEITTHVVDDKESRVLN